jgi:hypothetical protein
MVLRVMLLFAVCAQDCLDDFELPAVEEQRTHSVVPVLPPKADAVSGCRH